MKNIVSHAHGEVLALAVKTAEEMGTKMLF